MENEKILEKITFIEEILKEMNQNVRTLLKENEDKKNEQLLVITRLENLADFIKNKHNVVIEEKEEYNSENIGD